MKKIIFILIAVVMLVIFQTSFLAPWFSGYFCPDALLVFLMAATVIFGFNRIWSIVVFSGIMMDIFTYSRVGSHVIIFVLAAYSISFLSRRFSVGDRGLGMAASFFWITLATWMENWGLFFLENWGVQKMFISLEMMKSFGFSALINIGFFFWGYKWLKKLERYYFSKEIKFNR